jgi:hypothetical protein
MAKKLSKRISISYLAVARRTQKKASRSWAVSTGKYAVGGGTKTRWLACYRSRQQPALGRILPML